MATVAIALISSCAGQGHVHLNVSINGGAVQAYRLHIDEMMIPLTTEEREIILRGLLKLHAAGKTKAQMRTSVIAGVNVTTA